MAETGPRENMTSACAMQLYYEEAFAISFALTLHASFKYELVDLTGVCSIIYELRVSPQDAHLSQKAVGL